jgi:hypothetical protein
MSAAVTLYIDEVDGKWWSIQREREHGPRLASICNESCLKGSGFCTSNDQQADDVFDSANRNSLRLFNFDFRFGFLNHYSEKEKKRRIQDGQQECDNKEREKMSNNDVSYQTQRAEQAINAQNLFASRHPGIRNANANAQGERRRITFS